MSAPSYTRRTLLQLIIRLLFEALPTLAIAVMTLRHVNFSYTGLDSGIGMQSVWLGAGLIAAYSLYFFKVRPLLTFVLLWLIYLIVHKIIGSIPGEFDVFYHMARFQLYSTLFIAGWTFGYLLAAPRPAFFAPFFRLLLIGTRYSFFYIVTALTIILIVNISDTSDISTIYLLKNLIPLAAYVLYMLFVAPLLADSLELNGRKSLNLLVRLVAVLGLVLVSFFVVTYFLHGKLEASKAEIVRRNGGKGNNGKGDQGKDKYDERKGLLERGPADKPDKGQGGKGDQKGQNGDKGDQKDKGGKDGEDGEDSGYRLKDTMSMSDQMSQADYIMFCSKLKNYFPDGSPKPLYFVYHYLTKYDPRKESFTRDTAVPYLEELNVDPSVLPMYRTRTDSTVIRNSLANKSRKVVEAEVYVSSNTWKHALLAPSAAFSCQTIPVDSSYKKMFRSAYKVKCYTSDLNNAYFVYNPSANPMLEGYQEERYNELRTVKNYSATDSVFYDYYTDMPKGPLYDSIEALAQRITKDAKTPVDKVIAIRDFFLQRDKEGNRIFRYTLKPGVPSDPNIPNSTMLRNFLFRTHAGYCTYYAGASLFMLRSVGIPSRFTTGFATIDRSDKNKGWYWFYASQAHAWTQVYFPGYGWLDFDMTIGNDDQRESPQPDGTPPLPPPEPWLVLMAKAETAPNLQSKQLDASFQKLIFFNDDYRLNAPLTRTIDASVCRVLYDKKDTTLSCIQPGDSIVIVSYDDAAKKIPQPRYGVSIDQQFNDFPKPIIADEIHIKPREQPKQEEEKKKNEKPGNEKDKLSWKQVLLRIGIIAGGLVVLLFLLPSFCLLWLLLRLKTTSQPKTMADRAYRLALYHFHMAGIEREFETARAYAIAKVDPKLGTRFAAFMDVYLRLKYGNGQVMPGEPEAIRAFASSIRSSARKKIGFFNVLSSYLNLSRANRYFRRPPEQNNEA